MRIATWNVEYAYATRLSGLQQVLADNDADIWVLTETHDDLVPPGALYVAHSMPRPKSWSGIRPGSRWVSIWSRWPVIAEVSLPEADCERTVAALIDTGSQKLLVYGTVLPWKGDRGKFDWSEHHRVIPLQCAEWLKLHREHSDAMLCVAGDYNTDMGTGSYYGTKAGIATLSAGLADCGLYCATAPEHFPEGLLPRSPIDHIAVPLAWRNRVSITAAWPAAKGILSDHSGLVVHVSDPDVKTPAGLSKDRVVARATNAAFGRPLVTNVHRSMLVEAMIAEVLEPEWTWCAADYASYDFRHLDGTRLEVKQSAALQTWNADTGRPSKSSFDIAPRTGEYVDGIAWKDGVARNADIYVFAHHPLTDETADHREPDQWLFFVVPEGALPTQRSIVLSGIANMAEPVRLSDLHAKVRDALDARRT